MLFGTRFMRSLLLSFIIISGVPLLLIGVAVYFAFAYNLTQIERAELSDAIPQITSAVQVTQSELVRLVTDYGNWDEMHTVVKEQSSSADWFKTNISPEAPTSLYTLYQLNLVAIWADVNKEPLYSVGAVETVKAQLGTQLNTTITSGKPFNTLVAIGNALYGVAVTQVRTSDNQDPIGLLFIGRQINDRDAEQVKAYTGYETALYRGTSLLGSTSEQGAAAVLANLEQTKLNGQVIFEIGQGDYSTLYYPVNDAAGQNLYTVVLSRPRGAAQAAQSRMFVTLGLAAVAALALAGTLAWLASRAMAAPLGQVVAAAQRIVQGDFSQRITVGTRDEIGQIAQSFNQMAESLSQQIQLAAQEKERLQLLNEYRLNLFRAITQAFQSPLMQLQTLAQSLYMEMYGSLNEVQRETVVVMRRTINRQGALLSDLIDFSQAERHQLKLTRQRVSLLDSVNELAASLNVLYSAKNVQLVVDVASNLRTLFVDKSRTDQVLQQLLTWTYYLCVPNGEVRFYAKQEGNHAAIVLTDTSSGLSDVSKEQLFEIFFVPAELDNAQSSPDFLPGLGLAFVKSIVEQMDGTVEVSVTPGKGNAFRITLPTID